MKIQMSVGKEGSAIVIEDRLDAILAQIREEVLRAAKKHPAMHSPHEGYAVIKEEVEELWDEVKKDFGYHPHAMLEARHIAAMGIRYNLDLGA
jgi:hypothetical protein